MRPLQPGGAGGSLCLMASRLVALGLCVGAAGLWVGCDEGHEPNPPPVILPTGRVELTVTSLGQALEVQGRVLPVGRVFHRVGLRLVNQRSVEEPGGYDHFKLLTELTGGPHHPAPESAALPMACAPGGVAAGAQRSCELVFETASDRQPMRLDYDAGDGVTAQASFAGVQPPPPVCPSRSAEDTLAACSDGCNNDGDPYFDCNDADCCTLRQDCPLNSYCGANAPECISGPEIRYSSCTDSCDNEGDGYLDCEDLDCCGLLDCGAGTACGAQPDPFSGTITFDDAAVARLDPATLLAGPTPCRAPALVEVQRERDGDTLEVLVVGSGLEEAVRLIGADTPEIAHSGNPADCYGNEARTFTRQFVGHRLWLTFDGDCLDPFDRTLAYAYYGGDTTKMLQRQLLRRGFARPLPFPDTAAFEAQFEADATVARTRGRGLHQACP